MIDRQNFATLLLDWYDKEARTLPWRSDPTPYRVWISEMMLQQTRVDTVIPYFQRFVSRIPDIKTLSEIEEDKLLKLWQGLGYYSRALNLKKAAIAILAEHDGKLPDDRRMLEKLPGIGPYSAGAISSIAFQKVETLMDGNVMRVIARLDGIDTDIGNKSTQQRIQKTLEELISQQRPGDFNQALMELGATRCLPNGAPLCDACPFSGCCVAALDNRINEIPVKMPKKPREIQKMTVLVLSDGLSVGIEKRLTKGILEKMWLFPMIEGHLTAKECKAKLLEAGYRIDEIEQLPETKHIFTHIEWRMIGYKVHIVAKSKSGATTWATKEEIDSIYPIPTAHRFYEKYI
jgi:A/G-specific adenine glycosylase